jgi:hypothetical protein
MLHSTAPPGAELALILLATADVEVAFSTVKTGGQSWRSQR